MSRYRYHKGHSESILMGHKDDNEKTPLGAQLFFKIFMRVCVFIDFDALMRLCAYTC